MPPPSSKSFTSCMSSNSNQSPMLCPSSTGYTLSQAPTNVSTAQLQSTSIYQVKSPIISSSPSSTPFSSAAAATKIQVGGPMAPATINIPQPTQPVPTALNSHPSSLMTSNPVQQVPVMQIIQTQSPTGTNRHQPVTMKPIQPKPQQILPKPAGITNQVAYGGGKPVTLAAQRAPSTVNISTAGHQTNPLVIGQGQTILPNSGMVSQGGTLLLNHILGMGQNQYIFPSGTAGLPPNVQLVMRSQPSASNTVPASQSSTSMPSASAMNNALLAAIHAQTQAANQQAYINQSKALASQGQTVVMQAGQTLRAATPPQITNATLRPNMISGTHMVNQGQPPLVLQQIQGPITVIQALQGANVGVGSTGITLANPSSAAGISQLGGILQGAVASSLPQSIVLNNQPVITTTVAPLIGSMGDAVNGAIGQQQTQQQPQQQQTQPRAQSVNLEELLKQAGIMPDDPAPSSPQPAHEVTHIPVETQQPIYTFSHLPQMTTDCISMMNGPQTVVMGQDQFQMSNNQSTLVAHLQQPMVSQQLQSGVSVPTHMKLSLAQDGSVIIQRPVLTQGPALTLSTANQQTLQPHQVTFTVANLSTVSTGSTTTTATTMSNIHPMQSVMFQSVDGASQIQTQNATSMQQQQQQLAAAAAASAAASIIPLSLQGINLVSGLSSASTYVPTSIASVGYSPTVSQHQLQQQPQPTQQQQAISRCGTPVNSQVDVNVTGRNSMLSQHHPKLVQTLSNEVNNVAVEKPLNSSSSITVTLGGSKILQQSPLLVHSLGNREVEAAQTILPASGPAGNTESCSPSPSCGVTSSTSLPVVTQLQSQQPPQQPQAQPIGDRSTVLVAGCPVPGVKPLHKIQTIQLSTQGQEALQRIQAQLQVVLARKPRTTQDWQQIQILQNEQQKILSQGKVLSVQTQPLVQQFQKPQVPTSLDQPRCLQPKTSNSSQLQVPNPVIISSAHCTSSKLTPNGANIRATSARNAATFQVSSSSVLQATPTSTVITSTQPPPHIKIGNQIYTLAPAQQQQQTNIIGHQIKPLTAADVQNQQQLYPNQTKQGLILKIQQQLTQQQSPIPTQSDNNGTNIQNFPTGVAQIQQMNRGVKRPASTPASRSNLIHQRLAADHNSVLCPDHKSPFRSKRDAIKRLLPYHVLVGRTMSALDLRKDDEMFNSVSQQLVGKMHHIYSKYRFLSLKGRMKVNSTAEEVMLDKLFIQEETAALERDRQSVKEGKELDLPLPPPHWMDVVKTEPGYNKSLENECSNTAFLNGEPVHVKQEPIDEPVINSRDKRKTYDEWAEIQKELEMYPMGGDDISGGTEPVEFEPPSGGTSPVVEFEPPSPKIPKHEMISFKEQCQINHIQRNHKESFQPASFYQPHSLTMRSETSHWNVSGACSRISHPNVKCNEDENAVLGLEDITGIGVCDSVNNRLNHHHQSHEDEDGDSNDMTGLFAAAAAASVENNRSGSVDDDSQDDELSAQVQCAINSILNLQRIDESCDAYPMPSIVNENFCCVTESSNSAVMSSGGNQLLGDGELQNNDDSNNKTKCSYFGFKREEETVREVEDRSVVDQQTLSYEASNAVVQHAAVQHENMVSYSMDGPSDIDIALDEAVKSILL